MCGNCRTTQGPFTTLVLPLTAGTVLVPAKSQIVLRTCGIDSRDRDKVYERAKECNARRALLEEEGGL